MYLATYKITISVLKTFFSVKYLQRKLLRENSQALHVHTAPVNKAKLLQRILMKFN